MRQKKKKRDNLNFVAGNFNALEMSSWCNAVTVLQVKAASVRKGLDKIVLSNSKWESV